MRSRRWGKHFRTNSAREQALSFNATERFYAAAAGKDAVNQRVVAPKREIRRPVDKRVVGPTEHQMQAGVISWWWLQHEIYGLPVFALFAVPNGGARDAITGSLLKAEGVRRGSPDLVLAKPNATYHGLFIEMKVGDNKPTPEQAAFATYLEAVGYKATTHWSAESAINEIKDYLA